MMDPDETTQLPDGVDAAPVEAAPKVPALVQLWSLDEPERVGEVVLVPPELLGTPVTLGRAPAEPGDPIPRLGLVRQRPGQNEATGPLGTSSVSRAQLQLLGERTRLRVENLGRGELLHRGRAVKQVDLTADASAGDLLEISQRALFLVAWRRPVLPPFADPALAPPLHPWGRADACGIVGESPATWALRERLHFLAGRAEHVLVRGPSGTGKELVAQALHAASARGSKALISRNAATIPATLVDAELFGQAKNYPNTGSPERPGLIGEAHGSTLFLDEFAELPVELQAHLLRVLDAGEYHRLGESRPRVADLRLIAATNRPDGALKADVLARLKLRIEVPGLDARREDVPLIARHLLEKIAEDDPQLAGRFFTDGAPRLTAALARGLARHPYGTHVRELEALLWEAMSRAREDRLDVWPGFPRIGAGGTARLGAAVAAPAAAEATGSTEPARASDREPVDPNSLTAEEVQACLDRHDGAQEPAWRELGLSSRHALARLVKKYDLKVRGRTR